MLSLIATIYLVGGPFKGSRPFLCWALPCFVTAGREEGSKFCALLGLYRDNGKEHGSYYSIWGYIGIIEKKLRGRF